MAGEPRPAMRFGVSFRHFHARSEARHMRTAADDFEGHITARGTTFDGGHLASGHSWSSAASATRLAYSDAWPVACHYIGLPDYSPLPRRFAQQSYSDECHHATRFSLSPRVAATTIASSRE